MQNFLKRAGMLAAFAIIVFICEGCRGPQGWVDKTVGPRAFKEQPVDRIAMLGIYNQTFVPTKSSMGPFVVEEFLKHDPSLTVMPAGEVLAKLQAVKRDGDLLSMIDMIGKEQRIPVALGEIGTALGVDAMIVLFITNVEQVQGGTGRESATGATIEAHILTAGITRVIWAAPARGTDFGFGYFPPPAPDKAVQMAVSAMFKQLPSFLHRSAKP